MAGEDRGAVPEEEQQKLGLTRDTWSLEVVSDPDHPVRLGSPLTTENGTALDFETKTNYDVTVQVDDATSVGSPDDTALHTLNISDAGSAAGNVYALSDTTFRRTAATPTGVITYANPRLEQLR